MFMFLYYGLMRIGEVAKGCHSIKARNVHSARNKNKILLVLFSSKTHGRESRPQFIKITELGNSRHVSDLTYCPFSITNKFLDLRGGYYEDTDNLFIFADGSPVLPSHVRRVLKWLLTKLALNPDLYDTHSFRIGRATDLSKAGHSLEYIKRIAGGGPMRSTVILDISKYTKNIQNQ